MENSVNKKSALTPKAILHQKYGEQACYRIEEVVEPVENGCPGLAIPHKGRLLFRCHLELPGLCVVSDAFTRKKDAEQSAAKLAIEKLRIQPAVDNPTPEQAWNELIGRISYLFSNEFLSTSHPLTSHFRAAFLREGNFYGFVPVSIIVTYDLKTVNLCKIIDAKTEFDPLLMISIVIKAARLNLSVRILDGELWMGKQASYSPDAVQLLLDQQPSPAEYVELEAIFIPSRIENPIKMLSLNVSSDNYYLNEIASNLNVSDPSRVLLSRNIGKASSEMRLFFPVPELIYPSSRSLEMTINIKENGTLEKPINKRASFLSGQNIQGDAIMAVVMYKWNNPDLSYKHVSLSTYYRTILSKSPTGIYKLSREAILAAELPCAFNTQSNWRGSLPRDILCMFCRHHRLSEPAFVVESVGSLGSSTRDLEYCRKTELRDSQQNGDCQQMSEVVPSMLDCFKCGVKILTRQNDLMIEYRPGTTFKKQSDAIQNSALKVLTWFNKYLKQLDMPEEELSSLASSCGIYINYVTLVKEFGHCHDYLEGCSVGSIFEGIPNGKEDEMILTIEGLGSGSPPSQGSLACISYAVALVNEAESFKRILESKDDFDFEVGTGAVINQIEACVTQMSFNQSTKFILEVPSRDLILAAAGESAKRLSEIPLYHCKLEYSIKLLGVTEPLEDRLEQAFFSPPLSKQRVDFAVNCINGSLATSLVDFGCGSGSLLDSLIDQPTTLEKIVGVDISRKGLTRAAKILHSKLSVNADSAKQPSIRVAELYDGSITDFDSRIYGYDIGTCLEVVEHMEEDQATAFGDIVLSTFCPKLLIVSTPNYEYNVILQKNSLSNKEDDPDEKSQIAACKFRNHDHKFEWTRAQFECWASALTSRHSYSVEFSGVGGSGEEPGYASQIAVFTQHASHPANTNLANIGSSLPYEMVWQWQSESMHIS